jgi:hypothetical protein
VFRHLPFHSGLVGSDSLTPRKRDEEIVVVRLLVAAAAARGLGLVLRICPNVLDFFRDDVI